MSDLIETTKRFLTTINSLKTFDIFPKRMIDDTYKYSSLCDFEVLFSHEYFLALKSQLRSGLDYFNLVVTAPDPLEYFWKNFNWVPLITIDQQLDFKEYVRLLNADPGGSPADAIIYNSFQVIVADNNFEMIFVFMREKEIGVGYFIDAEKMARIKQVQNFGIIDPKRTKTIPSFLRAQVEAYTHTHKLM